jgi:23S rRNA pseudouridine1911/1915/1917 synthase
MNKIKYKGEEIRLDIYLKNKLDLSRTYIQKLIKSNSIIVNKNKVKPSHKLENGDIIEYDIPKPKKLGLKAENIPLEIVYEDKHLLVINKPEGLMVHPAQNNYSNTLVNAILWHCPKLSGIGGVGRPGIVHRLDKFTSGLIIIAKNDKTHQKLSQQFKDHKVEKKYLALVYGTPNNNEGEINKNITRHSKDRKKFKAVSSNSSEGRTALTYYKTIKSFNTTSLLEITPKTGRTHQIRVHLESIGHPIVGDPYYNNKNTSQDGQLLHAYYLKFIHPITKKNITITTMLPKRFNIKDKYINTLFKKGKVICC